MVGIRKEAPNIRTWKQFARFVRSEGCNLLKRLDEFPSSILVTGCQRSGTTMLSRIITLSEGMTNYWFGKDDELDAALILAGYVEYNPSGRYCFQTTYLNQYYREYYEHLNNNKIIWVLRNPFSVVYSMIYNWRRFALNELFIACGSQLLEGKQKRQYELFSVWGVNKLHRACLSYNGKVLQLFNIKEKVSEERILVVDYDELVTKKKLILPTIYRFIDLSYKEEYSNKIYSKAINKYNKLSRRKKNHIAKICEPVYNRARVLISDIDIFGSSKLS